MTKTYSYNNRTKKKLNEEDFCFADEYLKRMSQYSILFTPEEEAFHAVRKWSAQRRLEKILSDSTIHAIVQSYFLKKKEEAYKKLKETFNESDGKKLKIKINLYKSLLIQRHESYQKLEELKKQRLTKELINEQKKYSAVLTEHIKEFNDFNGINQHFKQSKLEGLEKYERVVNKLCSRYEFEKNNFLTHNWSFAFSKAKKKAGKGVPLIDLIQSANVGILKAFERFDPARKNRFITYAGWWILDELSNAICETGKTVKVPSDVKNIVVKLKQLEDLLITQEERVVDIDKVIDHYETLHGKIRILSRTSLKQAVLIFGKQQISYDQPVEGRESAFIDLIESTEELPETICSNKEQMRKLKYCLSLLDKKDQKLLESVFGLNNTEPILQTEIGRKNKITGNAIGLRKDKALEKLRFYWQKL